MRKSKIKQISLAVCLALLPLSSYAAGLGKLNVNSGIGEPLKAEIELLSVTPEELSTLAASLASEDAYAQQGIQRLGIHNNIKVEVAKTADGSPILKIHSNQPVSDPYLDMLIQVDWATGRLQREYTVLLDPPGYKPEIASSAPVSLPSTGVVNNTQAKITNSVSSTDAAQPLIRNVKKQKKSSVVATQQELAPAGVVAQELTTKRGDTLSAVAKELQVEGVSLDQMLAGLYENNKEAFAGGNMNRLKVGQIIKVPSKEVLTSIDNQQADKTIKIHSVNWNAYRNALAGRVEASPAMAEAEQKQSSSGKIATAEDKAAPVATGPKDVVKLSAGDNAGTKNIKDAAAKSAEAKIVALQEETTARENSLKEANDKAAALEKQIADMQKLIAMKNQSMAEMQKNAEVVANKPEDAEAPKTEAVEVADVKPVEVTTPPVAAQVKKPAVTPVAVVEEPSFLSGLMNSVDLTMLGGAGGVALLGAGWMYLRNKRRKDLDSFERGILTSGGLRANTVFGNTTGNASMSDTSFLTDFAQSADGSMIDTNDVDPIAEAEVYMAYGRDAQAEEILKDAITKEPKRYELHLKLLELYAASKDTSAFETIAGELYTTLGAGDPTWAKVAVIGSELEPSNPLYNLSNSVGVPAVDASDLVDTLVEAKTTQTEEGSDAEILLGKDFEFSTEEDANSVVMQSFTEEDNADSGLSFDMGTIDDVAPALIEEIETDEQHSSIEVSDTSSNLMDFDMGDFSEKKDFVEESDESENLVPEVTVGSLELNAPDISSLAESEETQSADFDMDFSLPSADDVDDVKLDSSEPNIVEDISFNLDFSTELEAEIGAESEEPKGVMDASEITFDLPEIEESVTPVIEESPDSEVKLGNDSDELQANAFDLSNIDLNLEDAESELPVEKPLVNPVVSSASNLVESPDVNIKLDLVDAYIDMDDKEGARELLEEILKDGGPQQQIRAKVLLDGLA